MKKFIGFCFLTIVLLILGGSSIASARSVYRMVLVGNSDYHYMTELKGATMDIDRVKEVYERAFFKDENIVPEIFEYKNVNAETILEAVSRATEGLGGDDVLFFYYSGHGKYLEETNQSYLIGIDEENESNVDVVSANDLEMALDIAECTKVVVIDACQSGGVIQKSSSTENGLDYEKKQELENFNKGIIEPFKQSSNQRVVKGYVANYMNRDGYKVMTAAAQNEYSYEAYNYGIGYGGQFSANFVRGMGYIRGEMFADENDDGIVTQSELYDYIAPKIYSSVQVYPENSNFEMMGREVFISPESVDTEKRYEMVQVGEVIDLNVIISPQWASKPEIEWTSSDESIVKNEEGLFEAVGCGEAILSGRSIDSDIKLEKKIEVIEDDVKIFDYRGRPVSKDKLWSIRFNQKLSTEGSLPDVRLIDANGECLDFDIVYSDDGYLIEINSEENYTEGMDYELLIKKGFRSKLGNILKNSVWLRFRIEK